MTAAWGQDAEAAEAEDDSPVAAADDYPDDPAGEVAAEVPEASAVAEAEDPLDQEIRATEQQLQILEKLILYHYTCLLRWTRGLYHLFTM